MQVLKEALSTLVSKKKKNPHAWVMGAIPSRCNMCLLDLKLNDIGLVKNEIDG